MVSSSYPFQCRSYTLGAKDSCNGAAGRPSGTGLCCALQEGNHQNHLNQAIKALSEPQAVPGLS